MSQKVHKGSTVIVEGGVTAEAVQIMKIAKNTTLQVEYIGECKVGTDDIENHHYIEKITYDVNLCVDRILIAQNQARTGATIINIQNVGSPVNGIRLTLTDGFFGEINVGDLVFVHTILNKFSFKIKKILSNSDVILTTELPVIDEIGAVVGLLDVLVTYNDDSTKDYAKRRWNRRELYIYR